MAIGKFRVELDSGTTYSGQIEQLSWMPFWKLPPGQLGTLTLSVGEYRISDPGLEKCELSIEGIAAQLVAAIREEMAKLPACAWEE